MTIKLHDYEKGEKFHGDYDDALADVQKRLAKVQVANIIRSEEHTSELQSH